MSTRYAVDVRIAPVAGGAHESTCTCTCGWSLTTREGTSQMATRVSDRARANHFEDAHPDQHSRATLALPAPPAEHEPALSGSARDGFGWSRTAVCACGWEARVVARTPFEAAGLARGRHRHHVSAHLRGAARRDDLSRWGVLAIILVALLTLATYVVPSLR